MLLTSGPERLQGFRREARKAWIYRTPRTHGERSGQIFRLPLKYKLILSKTLKHAMSPQGHIGLPGRPGPKVMNLIHLTALLASRTESLLPDYLCFTGGFQLAIQQL